MEESPVVLAGVDHQAEQMAATPLIAQGDLGLALRHVEADVQDLEEQQVEQTRCHHAAVPGTGETQRRAGENNTTGEVQHLGPGEAGSVGVGLEQCGFFCAHASLRIANIWIHVRVWGPCIEYGVTA